MNLNWFDLLTLRARYEGSRLYYGARQLTRRLTTCRFRGHRVKMDSHGLCIRCGRRP